MATRLLVRSRTGCVPTSAGQRVLAKARLILRLTDSLIDPGEDGAAVIGCVRIACFRSVSTHLLPLSLEALAVEYPGIRVDIDDNCEEREDVVQAVEESRADIGVAQLPIVEGWATRPYVSDSYVLVVPASLPLRAPVSWEQLRDVPYIQLGCSGALAVLRQCREAGFNAEPSRTLTADSSIAAMVRRGLGYSILPRLAVFPKPDGVRIVDLPIPAKRHFALVALPGTAREKAVQIVMNFIRNKRFMTRSDAFRAGLVEW